VRGGEKQQLNFEYAHREIKKKILGMRGEEWGKIVVDGTSTSRLFTCGTILLLPPFPPSTHAFLPHMLILDLELYGHLEPLTLVKEWEVELERMAPTVQVRAIHTVIPPSTNNFASPFHSTCHIHLPVHHIVLPHFHSPFPHHPPSIPPNSSSQAPRRSSTSLLPKAYPRA